MFCNRRQNQHYKHKHKHRWISMYISIYSIYVDIYVHLLKMCCLPVTRTSSRSLPSGSGIGVWMAPMKTMKWDETERKAVYSNEYTIECKYPGLTVHGSSSCIFPMLWRKWLYKVMFYWIWNGFPIISNKSIPFFLIRRISKEM